MNHQFQIQDEEIHKTFMESCSKLGEREREKDTDRASSSPNWVATSRWTSLQRWVQITVKATEQIDLSQTVLLCLAMESISMKRVWHKLILCRDSGADSHQDTLSACRQCITKFFVLCLWTTSGWFVLWFLLYGHHHFLWFWETELVPTLNWFIKYK